MPMWEHPRRKLWVLKEQAWLNLEMDSAARGV